MKINSVRKKLESVYENINRLSGGRLGVLRQALTTFGRTRASQAAAAMAYYAVFSLFPLMLVLVSAMSYVVDSARARQEVVNFVAEFIPVSQRLIEQNIESALEVRGPVGIAGLVGLAWSATSVFIALTENVSRAWPDSESRNYLEERFVGLAIVGVLLILLVLSILSSALLSLMPRLNIPLLGGTSIYESALWPVMTTAIPLLLTFLLFLFLYRWVPDTEVSWKAACGGALLAAVAWELAKNIFTWYLASGLVQYELVYGSLGAVVALMLWTYLSSLIILFGAHFSAALTIAPDARAAA